MQQIVNKIKRAFPNLQLSIAEGDRGAERPGEFGIVFASPDKCQPTKFGRLNLNVDPEIEVPENAAKLAASSRGNLRLQIVPKGEKVGKGFRALAAITDTNLYLAISQLASNTVSENLIVDGLDQLIEQVVEVVSVDTSENHFYNGIRSATLGRREQLEKELAATKETADSYLMKAQRYIDAAQQKETLLESLKAAERGGVSSDMELKWHQLQRLIPRAAREIIASHEALYVITQPIEINGILLGSYRIEIRFSDLRVTINRVEGPPPGVGAHHPHVNSGGGVCWGNSSQRAADLRTKSDILGLVNLSIMLLHSYTKNDSYARIENYATGRMEALSYPSCCDASMSTALVRQCRTCLAEADDEKSCWRKDSQNEIWNFCRDLNLAPPESCGQCTIEQCKFFKDRFSGCFERVRARGTAYCVLGCDTQDCPKLEAASKKCGAENFSAKYGCPAVDQCRMPCEQAREAKEIESK